MPTIYELSGTHELPSEVDRYSIATEFNWELTTEANLRGYHLMRFENDEEFTCVLYDKWYHILKQWTTGYAVYWQDILDYCNENPA